MIITSHFPLCVMTYALNNNNCLSLSINAQRDNNTSSTVIITEILLSLACKCNSQFEVVYIVRNDLLYGKLICSSCIVTYSGNDTSTNTSCGGILSLGKGETKPFYCDPPIVGRYVSVVVPGRSKFVNMCEVEVYSVQQVSSGVTGDYGFI